MKAMVLGVGAIGSVTAQCLAESDEYDKILLGARNPEKGKRLAKKIGSDELKVVKLDASDVGAMTKALKGLDIVCNLAIPRFNFQIMEACEKARVNYLDTAWDIAIDKTPPGGIVKPAPPSFLYLKKDKAWHPARSFHRVELPHDPALLAADGYHPGPEVSRLWGQSLADNLAVFTHPSTFPTRADPR